jgi:hypothetical protein
MAEIPKDPSAATDHLTKKGKVRHHKIDRTAQWARYESIVDARVSELIPTELPKPGDNLKVKKKPVIGIDD